MNLVKGKDGNPKMLSTAGAMPGTCQAQDSMAMWRENNIDIVECVKCGHQMREADKEARDHVRKDEQVIKFSSGLAICAEDFFS